MENVTNPLLLTPMSRGCWFVTNKDYAAYDTLACVGNLKKSMQEGDMMTEDEILALQCNQPTNMEAVERPSKRWMRSRKQKKK